MHWLEVEQYPLGAGQTWEEQGPNVIKKELNVCVFIKLVLFFVESVDESCWIKIWWCCLRYDEGVELQEKNNIKIRKIKSEKFFIIV